MGSSPDPMRPGSARPEANTIDRMVRGQDSDLISPAFRSCEDDERGSKKYEKQDRKQ